MESATGSQFTQLKKKSGVGGFSEVKHQASAFQTSCRGLVANVEAPAKREMQHSRREMTNVWMSIWATSQVREGVGYCCDVC